MLTKTHRPIFHNDMHHTRKRKSISKTRRPSIVDEKLPARRTSLVAAISLLSLPSFSEHVNQLMNSLDLFDSYKKKIHRSSRKLENFFGEPTPVDVCISEIEKEGLNAMLESKVPLCYFLHYLLTEVSSENLLFFLEVERLETMKNKNGTIYNKYAQYIYDTYISKGSSLEINIDERVKRDISKAIRLNQQDVFDEAKSCTYILLESSYFNFLSSESYQAMLDRCGEYTIHYSEHMKYTAINQLFKYLENSKHKQRYTIKLKYDSMIEKVIKRFIKHTFGSNYISYHSH